MRSLFSQALSYPLPDAVPHFGLKRTFFANPLNSRKYVVFLHGTTWATKLWPESYWLQLANLAAQAGYRIKVSGGNEQEVARAKWLAKQHPAIDVFPYLDITAMAKLLANAQGAIAVDTGFGHLAAALDVPVVSLYGATNPEFTGAIGKTSVHLTADFSCAPCFSRTCTYRKTVGVTPACYSQLPPQRVWDGLHSLLLSS